ncbi:MAG: HEAT repeat domain-containing protein [Anaerolineae bacterium]|nr:HEAT repeat domain-containing protein [Phycisphaerae bacterium]
MKQLISLITAIALLSLIGCAGGGPDPMAKEIRPPKAPPSVPKPIAEPINPELRGKAKLVIEDSLKSSDPILRANSIEALQNTIGKEGADQIMRGLNDREAVVRFASAMAAGTLQLAPAKPVLLEMAQGDGDASVRVATRYALHRMGDVRLSHDLEKFAIDTDKWVRANTAMVLGRLGEKSALNVLRTMMQDREPVVRLQVFEAMWRLGDDDGLERLIGSSISQAPDDQIIATLALAEPRNEKVSGVIYSKLVSDYPETELAAARAMGMLGSDAGYTIAMNATRDADPRRRVMAAMALGAIGRSDAQPALTRLLGDQNPNVKLAAATAILQLKPPRT